MSKAHDINKLFNLSSFDILGVEENSITLNSLASKPP